MVGKTHSMTLCRSKNKNSQIIEKMFAPKQTIDKMKEVNLIYVIP